jgi:hypothetical protein
MKNYLEILVRELMLIAIRAFMLIFSFKKYIDDLLESAFISKMA